MTWDAQIAIDVVIIQPGIIKTEFEAETARQPRETSGSGAYRQIAEAMASAAETQADHNDPGVVATTIRQAIESAKPETRYAVGWLAETLLGLNRTLSARVFDARLTGSLK
ncbi:hypothetical protein [Streptosporangium sp. KLBMP 9127]|nr:hypothetical protein [Streptosporangium sp. KLBMP 9127]